MIDRLFLDHPRSVGESYLEHQRQAFVFGAAMLLAGLPCVIHGLIPGVFPRRGRVTVSSLHQRMVQNRVAPRLPVR